METTLKVLFFLVMAVAGIVLLWLLAMFLHWLWMIVFFSFHYGNIHTSPGKVVGMKYTAAYTTYTYTTVNNVTTMTPNYHPAQYDVTVKTDERTTTIGSQTLYKRVDKGDKVELTFQRCYHLPRFWEGAMKFDSYRLLTVSTENGKVGFNDPKPVDRKVVQIEENMDLRK